MYNLDCKVEGFDFITDGDGIFIPYCMLPIHQGVIRDFEYCQEHSCPNFKKIFVSLIGEPDKGDTYETVRDKRFLRE